MNYDLWMKTTVEMPYEAVLAAHTAKENVADSKSINEGIEYGPINYEGEHGEDVSDLRDTVNEEHIEPTEPMKNGLMIENIVMIGAFFMIAGLCLLIGLFFGTKVFNNHGDAINDK